MSRKRVDTRYIDKIMPLLKSNNTSNSFANSSQVPEGKSTKKNLFDKYFIGDILGEGANAVVKLLQPIGSSRKELPVTQCLAIKIFKDRKNWPTAKMEARILQGLEHKNIIKFKGLHREEEHVYLILEYFHAKNLAYILQKRKEKSMDEYTVKIIVKQVVEALAYCHDRGVYHLDVKPENILVDKNDWKIKIIDFAFSVKSIDNSRVKRYCGTPSYMCPEVLQKESFHPDKADVWAVGILAYKLYTGKAPFKGSKAVEILEEIKNYSLDKDALKSCTHDFRDFLTKTLRRNYDKRETMSQLAKHSFLLSTSSKRKI